MKTGAATRRFRPWRAVAFLAALAVFSLAASGVSAYWSAGSGTGGNGTALATTVGAGAMPTATAAGTTVNLSWAASTLADGSSVSGYVVKRYNATTLVAQTILTSCTGVIATTSCTESSVPTGQWRYSITPVVGTNWTGAESPLSAVTYTDPTAPVNNLSLSNITGGAAISGATAYYRGIAAGSFTITNALTDADSGPASSSTSALAGATTGWAHAPSTVSAPTGGPYVSNTFSWLAGTTTSPTETITGRDLANNTAVTTGSLVNDSTAPTGTISYTTGYQAGRFVTLTLTAADSGSGLASAQLQRASASFVNGTCQAFGAFANLGAVNPASPYKDSTVSNATCYNYRYVLTDLVGNTFTATSPSTAWVDYAGAVRFETTGIVSQLRFGDSSVGGNVTAVDSLGNNNAVYTNGVVQGAAGELPNDSNTSATLDGTNDYIEATTTGKLPTGNSSRSVELWFKTSSTAHQSLFTYGSRANNEEFGLWIDAGGATLTAWGYGGGDDPVFTPSASVEDGKWHQVVETYDGTSVTLYLDGVSLGAQAMTRNTVIDSYGLQIGDVVVPSDINSGFNFNGSLDEFSIYSAVLSQTDVTNHYQLGANTSADTTGPTGGSVSVAGLTGVAPYSTSTTLKVTLAKGTDASGVAAAGALLFRASATLTSTANAAGVCGTFGNFTLVATDPITPYTDGIADGACYAYRYSVPDTLGNYSTYASSIIMVDATAPATPTLAISGLTANVTYSAGVISFKAAKTGSFTVTVAATDPTSGIPTTGYTFGTTPTGWTPSGTATAARKYTFTATASTGSIVFTVTNNAGLSSTVTLTLVHS